MFFKLIVLQASVLLGLLGSASALCIASPVSVRLPPTFDNGLSTLTWLIPPIGWDFGYWFQTNSSSPNTFQRNLQYSSVPLNPLHPIGPRTDLSSFQTVGNATVYTSYGIDSPLAPGFVAAYNYTGTGILGKATDFLEVLAWGTDCHGVGYRVSHSTFTAFTQTPASVDVLSRSKRGPDATTLTKIQHALIALGNAEITALASALGPALQDSGRDGLPRVESCDDACQTNENLLPLLGGA
ncbi:hypothetical protein B0H66DRAFT_311540 [Apodospora peruviana]|uniref:Heme haloperoxidase family profile domain-containing protein n=1 Tax=Apodospora peruviana TaxID=516989 RepID=A0AAE0M2U0_9PEZI|nr:hypothetical protein B0H66DRAFT_311540 [Apodospora peruviana]